MANPRALWLTLGAISAGIAAFVRPSAAADKTSLGCIQASDDGQTARDSGDLLHARELLAVCAASKCPAPIRRDCTSWLEEVQRQIPSVVLGAHDTAGHDPLQAKGEGGGGPKSPPGSPPPLPPRPPPRRLR